MEEALRAIFGELGGARWRLSDIGWCMAETCFHESTLIDAEVEKAIDELSVMAPLHNPHNLEAIARRRNICPG